MSEFKGKVVWVTGAGTGIGRAGALMFARGGATVALMGRRRDKLEEVAKEIEAFCGAAVITQLDVANRDEVTRSCAVLIEKFGKVDIVVNNAGLNVQNRRLDELRPADWDAVIGANLTGAFNMVHAAFEPMKKLGDGLVINVASTAAKRVTGVAGAAYSASKFGMLGLSLSLSQEAFKFGIRACCICPDDVNTPILQKRKYKYSEAELAEFIQPEDIADTMRFIALLPKRSSIHEMIIYPTNIRAYTPTETGAATKS
jgi:NADP-dependent 3-hydroxy acid dehydrogenase YdfG